MPTTVTFGYTGAQQSTTVPAGVTTATLSVSGSAGGDHIYSGYAGGNGAVVEVTITALASGETLYAYVGGVGSSSSPYPGGWNGGGAGLNETGTNDGMGGGGASDIRRGGTALANRIVVGGGGGGAGNNTAGDGTGGKGGYPDGGRAAFSYGGTQSGPGVRWNYPSTASSTYLDYYGTLGQGATQSSYTSGSRANGGGGGGLWGGNTFRGAFNFSTGGGGGSSYYDTGDANVTLVLAESSAAASVTGVGGITIIFADPATEATVTLGALSATATGTYNTAAAQRSARRQYVYISDISGVQKGVIL